MVVIYSHLLLVHFALLQLHPYSNLLQGGQLGSPARVGKEEVTSTEEKQLSRKMKGQPTKKIAKKMKKTNKKNVIDVGESNEE